MAIIVKKAFDGVPDGECHPCSFEVGDELTGDLAQVALAQKWAQEEEAEAEAEAKAKAEEEAKAKAEEEAKAKAEEEAKAKAKGGK